LGNLLWWHSQKHT